MEKTSRSLTLFSVSIVVYIILIPWTAATGINYTPNLTNDMLIKGYDSLPFKNQRGLESWSQSINSNYSPSKQWDTNLSESYGDDIAFKCLSYASSTVNDWFIINSGGVSNEYKSLLHGKYENGTNPRLIESMYYQRAMMRNRYYRYVPFYLDPVTNEPIPYYLIGFAIILNNPETDWIDHTDLWLDNAQEFTYSFIEDRFPIGNFIPIAISRQRNQNDIQTLKFFMDRYGPILSFTERINEFVNIHSVTLIGYGNDVDGDFFIAHDNYGSGGSGDFSEYKKLRIEDIDHAYAFTSKGNWPSFCHDNRNTCRTLLKGDFDNENRNIENFFIKDEEGFARTSIADIDNNGEMDIVMTVNNKANTNGWVYAYEVNWAGKIKNKWLGWDNFEIGHGITNQPTLADIDNNGNLEILFGLANGSVLCLDHEGELKWSYDTGSSDPYIGEIKVSDLNLDGDKEIIFTNYKIGHPEWDGTLFILNDDGSSAVQADNTTISNGGSKGPVAIADLDADGKRDIIVTTFYGIETFEFDGSITSGWTTNEGNLEQNAMVFDIDKDNKYEIITVTTSDPCDTGKTCYDRLYVRNELGNNEFSPISLAYDKPSNPVAADVDDDGDIEIIVVEQVDSSDRNASISCFEADGSPCSGNWPYDMDDKLIIGDGFSPSVSDIDSDGREELIIHKFLGKYLYILDPAETTIEIPLKGKIASSPAIGDIDNDGNAEIAVSRQGSPFSILSISEENNTQPVFTYENHSIAAIVGEQVYINNSGKITATDPDMESLSYAYSYPFNESGYWTPNENETGNYTTAAEARDFGNLTDIMYVDLIVFDNGTNKTTTFSDNTSSKNLTYTGSQTKTVQIRMPKDVVIKLARLKLEGGP